MKLSDTVIEAGKQALTDKGLHADSVDDADLQYAFSEMLEQYAIENLAGLKGDNEQLKSDIDSAMKTIERHWGLIEELTQAIWSHDDEEMHEARIKTQENGFCFMCRAYDCWGDCREE